MSVCVFIAADYPLPEVNPTENDPLHVYVEDPHAVCDDGADDPFFLLPFDDVNLYCAKKYGVYLAPPLYTDGRASRIIDYIKSALRHTERVELWNVWLLGYWEYDDRPYIRKTAVSVKDLTIADIKEIIDAENWNNQDPNRPSFYCIEIAR